MSLLVPRSQYGNVPALTPAQRAQIITVDLDNPPPFMRTLRDLSETRIIAHEQTRESIWLYQPEWGEAAAIFNRAAAGDMPAAIRGESFRRVARTFPRAPSRLCRMTRTATDAVQMLGSPVAEAFVSSLIGMTATIAQAVGAAEASTNIEFKTAATFPNGDGTDVHLDDGDGFRGFCATEHGNPIFPDAVAAAAAGFVFQVDSEDGDNACIVDLIAAKVPVYTPPLGSVCFFRDTDLQSLGPPSWHAQFEIDIAKPGVRPCGVMNLHL